MRHVQRFLIRALAFVLILGLVPVSVHLQSVRTEEDALLTGMIRSTSGEKIAGVTVSAKEEGQTITTSVFTGAAGDYYFPRLHPGKYRVWAQAVGYETATEIVDLEANVHQDFALNPTKDFAKQLMGDQLIAALADGTPEERRLKAVIKTDCASNCHPASYIFQNRFDEAGWAAILNLMRKMNLNGYRGDDGAPHPGIEFHKTELAAYLARMRGPGPTAMNLKIPPRPSGEAARTVVTEYDVPTDANGESPTSDGSDWSKGIPSRLNGVQGVHDAVVDFNGNIWFTYSEPTSDRTLGRIDAKTGKVTNISTPKLPGKNGMVASTHGIVIDQHGIIWFDLRNTTEKEGTGVSGSFGRLDPNTGQIDVFTTPEGMYGPHATAEVDAKGGIWDTTDAGAVRFDPETGKFAEFKPPFPTVNAEGHGYMYGAAGDREGNGWWVDFARDYVFKADTKTGKTSVIKLPPDQAIKNLFSSPEERKIYSLLVPNSYDSYPWAQGPRRLGADLNGDTVWICNWFSGTLARIDIHTMKPTFIPIPSRFLDPYKAAVDSHHNVWVNGMNTDRVFRYDPSTSRWAEFDLPTRGTEARFMSILDRNGKLQVIVPYYRESKVARITFRTEEEIEALKKQAEQAQALR